MKLFKYIRKFGPASIWLFNVAVVGCNFKPSKNMVVDRNFGSSKITVVDRNFGPSKITIVERNVGPSKITIKGTQPRGLRIPCRNGLSSN